MIEMIYTGIISIKTLVEKMNKFQDRGLSKVKICIKCGAIFTTKTKTDCCYSCRTHEEKDPKAKNKKELKSTHNASNICN